MNKLLFILLILTVGCGYGSRDNEMIGQVKTIKHNTPLICPDYKGADISLGILREGIGSMSAEDVWVVITDKTQEDILKKANDTGILVKIKYDQKRITFCTPPSFITSVEAIP